MLCGQEVFAAPVLFFCNVIISILCIVVKVVLLYKYMLVILYIVGYDKRRPALALQCTTRLDRSQSSIG